MQKSLILIIGLVAVFGFVAITPQAESISIPPTAAFAKIIIGGHVLAANSYSAFLNIVGQGAISITPTTNSTIIIQIKDQSCPLGQFVTGFDMEGNITCQAP